MDRSQSEQQEFLASLIDVADLYDNAPCGYFSISPTGIIIKINRTLLTWLDYNATELIGQKFSTLLPKGGQMHFEMFFMPLAGVDKTVKELSYEVIRKDSTVIPVLLNASAVLDDSGKLAAVNCVLNNNAERRQYEKDLLQAKRIAERERKRLAFMADLIPEIIWTATAKGTLDYVNARFCQYFDCDGKETRASFILSKVHPEDRRNFLNSWHASLATGGDLEAKVRLVNTKGAYEWHLLRGAKFLDEQGNLTNWFGSCANIDAHINAMKKKDDFINIASHELKTPITSLKAILQLMDRLKTDPANKMLPGLIEKANRNVGKVNTLVEELLNVSQLNDGQLHLNKRLVDLDELIGDCVHHIRIDQQYEILTVGDQGVTIFADAGRIEQVINNFISNAIKYAPDSKQVLVNITGTPDETCVEVTDQGPGVETDKIPFLFDRYYQIENKGSKYSGLGLGLYICAEIIKRHGGKIGVNSKPGKGSTFYFSLPRQR